MAKRYKEVFDPNHSQECICHKGPMNRGLEESSDGDFVDIEDYEKLQQQLAKANERIAELESYNVRLANESHEYQQRCAELGKDLLRQSVFMEKTAVKLEQHREWQATASVLRRPTREAKQALKKLVFAQQIEGAFLFAEYLEGIPLVKICSREISSFSDLVGNFEQLRKEQE